MILSINQPGYLPWLGYLHRIAVSDLHIVLDHVQFEKNSFTNRNKIRTKDGWSWLTVPVRTKRRFGNLHINRLEIADDPRWAKKHWSSIRYNYARSPFFSQHATYFEDVYRQSWTYLIDLVRETTTYLLDAVDIKTPILFSSEMDIEGIKDELILNLAREVGANIYLSGPFGRDYLEQERFRAAGIEVAFHDYAHPTYPQTYAGFEPHMSAIDLLFNCGPESFDIMMSGA